MTNIMDKIKNSTTKQKLVAGAVVLVLIGGGTGIAVNNHNQSVKAAESTKVAQKEASSLIKEAIEKQNDVSIKQAVVVNTQKAAVALQTKADEKVAAAAKDSGKADQLKKEADLIQKAALAEQAKANELQEQAVKAQDEAISAYKKAEKVSNLSKKSKSAINEVVEAQEKVATSQKALKTTLTEKKVVSNSVKQATETSKLADNAIVIEGNIITEFGVVNKPKVPEKPKDNSSATVDDTVKNAEKEGANSAANDAAEKAVKNLEANQTNGNIAPAQEAVNKVTDANKKKDFQARIDAVKKAIAEREAAAKTPEVPEKPATQEPSPSVPTPAPSPTPAPAPAPSPAPTPNTPQKKGGWEGHYVSEYDWNHDGYSSFEESERYGNLNDGDLDANGNPIVW